MNQNGSGMTDLCITTHGLLRLLMCLRSVKLRTKI